MEKVPKFSSATNWNLTDLYKCLNLSNLPKYISILNFIGHNFNYLDVLKVHEYKKSFQKIYCYHEVSSDGLCPNKLTY